MIFILSSISSGSKFWLVNHTSIHENSESKVFKNIKEYVAYVVHIRNFKKPLNNGLVLKRLHRIIKVKQAWLKLHIDMNTDLRKKKQKMILKKKF